MQRMATLWPWAVSLMVTLHTTEMFILVLDSVSVSIENCSCVAYEIYIYRVSGL